MTGRRRFLRLCGVAGIGGVAGCFGNSQDSADQSGNSTETIQSRTEDTILSASENYGMNNFGYSMAISSDGTTALIGAPKSPSGKELGSAYIFSQTGESWTEQAKLSNEDAESEDCFGDDVALSGDGTTAFVGAPNEQTPDSEMSGAVHIFTADGDSWTQRRRIAAGDGGSNTYFVSSVSLSDDGTTAFVGTSNTNVVNVYTTAGGSWRQQATVTPAGDGKDASFWWSVSVSDDGTTALVGASDGRVDDTLVDGAAYIFETTANGWTQQASVTSDGTEDRYFGDGTALSSDGTTAFVGSPDEEVVYVFSKGTGSWRQQTKLSPTGDYVSWFGESVAASRDGGTAVVGAGGLGAYIFDRQSGSWAQQTWLDRTKHGNNDRYGRSVALSSDGTTALVGADRINTSAGKQAGLVYVHEL